MGLYILEGIMGQLITLNVNNYFLIDSQKVIGDLKSQNQRLFEYLLKMVIKTSNRNMKWKPEILDSNGTGD